MTGRGVFVGLTTLDMVHFLPSAPGRNDKAVADGCFIGAGGPATNAAVTFAALGGEAGLLSAVGRHSATSLIRDDLRASGVAHRDLTPDRTDRPAIASVFVSTTDGDRSVVASKRSMLADPRRSEWDLPPELDVLLLDGHEMASALRLAAAAKDRGIPVVFDGGSWKEGSSELLAYVDHALVSERFHPPMTGGSDEVLEFLLKAGPRVCAVTRGERPMRVAIRSVEPTDLAVPRIDAVDTLAAGDIFHGAYCHALLDPERGAVECLQYAAEVAAESCRYLGPREWIEARK